MAKKEELYKKISDLDETPEVYGYESIPLVQNGKTFRATFETIINWMFRFFGIISTVNTTEDLSNISVRYRKVVYVKDKDNGGMFNYSESGVVDDENVFPAKGGGVWIRANLAYGSNVNYPDGEDLESRKIGDIESLSFKNRSYIPDNFSGLGFTILRKNISNGKNILTSDMISANSVVEIRYDYDLNGAILVLPENVVLMFNGGSIKNGTIQGNYTKIEGSLYQIFYDIIFAGTYVAPDVYVEWFGAKGYPIKRSTSSYWWDTGDTATNGLESGVDSTNAIKKAIDLAYLTQSRAVLSNGSYKITNSIDVPQSTTLHIERSSGVRYYGDDGAGNIVITADKHNNTTTTQTFGGSQIALSSNQYFDTACLKKIITVHPAGGKITGGGVLSLGTKKYLIGVYMLGTSYWTIDMIHAPEIDIKIIGDSANKTAPSPTDYFLSGDWLSAENTAIGSNGEYAFNNIDNSVRLKADGTWKTWSGNLGNFNTLFRGESLTSGYRVINLKANFFGNNGFRGIELIGRNGGWFNQSYFRGAISTIHCGFVMIYGNTDQGILNNDFSEMCFQVGAHNSSENRVVGAYGNVQDLKFGYTWDLSWSLPKRFSVGYEFGKNVKRYHLEADGHMRFMNETDYSSGNYIDSEKDQMLFFNEAGWRNLYKYRTNRNSTDFFAQSWGYDSMKKFTEFSTSVSNYTSVDPQTSTPDYTLPRVFFDEDPRTSEIVIDTVNSLYGSSFYLWSHFTRTTQKVIIAVEYRLLTDNTDVYVWTRSSVYGLTKRLTRSVNENSSVANNIIYLDHASFNRDLRSLRMGFCTTGVGVAKLEVVNIKVHAQGDNIGNSITRGATSARPNACPRGHIYDDTTLGITVVNRGDSSVQNWIELISEVSGVWTISTNETLTAAEADFSKVGKQISLSGKLTFATPDTNVSIVLPYAPKYGTVYNIGDLTITTANNSTSATVKSSSAGANKNFQINFKTA